MIRSLHATHECSNYRSFVLCAACAETLELVSTLVMCCGVQETSVPIGEDSSQNHEIQAPEEISKEAEN
jgi:hypothetical protein